MIPDKQLDEWEKLCESATPGPWAWLDEESDFENPVYAISEDSTVADGNGFWANEIVSRTERLDGFDMPILAVMEDEGWDGYSVHRICGTKADARFVEAAREIVPALIAEVRRLRKIRPGSLEKWAQDPDNAY